MLIGMILEPTPKVSAAENIATRLADRIRNLWLEHTKRGEHRWEDNLFEDPDGVSFLREEAFPHLQGIDYIFRWWGSDDEEGLAGDLQLLWKVRINEEMKFYKTTIRFAKRDFIKRMMQSESAIREDFRAKFREAFQIWEGLYAAEIKTLEQ